MSDGNLKELYDKCKTAIDEIDEKLDSQGDQDTATKRKLTNELIEQYQSSWKPAAESLIAEISGADTEVQIGVYYGLVRELTKSFGNNLGEAVNALVEAQPKVEVEVIPPEEMDTLGKARSDLYGKIKSLIEMAKQFGMDEGMEMPKRRTGKKGKRGPRALTAFSWEIEGREFDKLKEVAEVYADNYETVGKLTEAMRKAGLNLKEPGDKLEFTLPDGKILVGTRDEDAEDDTDEDEDATEDEETTSEEVAVGE